MSSIKRSGTVKGDNSSALQRSATRKAVALTKKKVTLEDIQQGIKVLHAPDGHQDVDIVLVPGLGTGPESSWVFPEKDPSKAESLMMESTKERFNWTTKSLPAEFPKARILLYMYESSWYGRLQVQQFMGAIAKSLLVCLRSLREGRPRTPIVFIGHSMGGLVIAKAITLMASLERDSFPSMFEATTGCLFFGTPFGGTESAAWAAMYAYAAEKVNKSAQTSKLLDLMTPGNEELRTLKHEFMRLVNKLEQKIHVICFYEEQETNWASVVGLPSFFKIAIPKGLSKFVTRESATIAGVDDFGLARTHRDLVRFKSQKDMILMQAVIPQLRNVVSAAQLAVRNRFFATRRIDRGLISDILEALKGAQPNHKRKHLLKTFEPSSWIPKASLYNEWLGPLRTSGVDRGYCLWIRGPEGRGKTSAAMAVLKGVESRINLLEREESTQNIEDHPTLLAYFFCESTEEYSTAEDLLKSLISQIMSKKETLASHAKAFARKKGKDQAARQQPVQTTVENLWQVLLAMLADFADTYAGGRIYLVINNLHVLPEDSDSTEKLLQYLQTEFSIMANQDSKDSGLPTRWLITSRDSYNIRQAFGDQNAVKLIDLEDEKFENQVQLELRRHAKKKILELELAKNYNTAIAYYASSLIGKRGQNTQWIDITCVQLKQLPKANSDLVIRRVLEKTPHDLKTLLNSSWNKIFDACPDDVEKIKELLRSLVLMYEDPTEDELGVIAGLWSTPGEKEEAGWKEELKKLVKLCKPLLTVKNLRVSFMNAVIRTHLLENSEVLLGLAEEEIKWHHGVLAHRAFAHLRKAFDFPESEDNIDRDGNDGHISNVGATKELVIDEGVSEDANSEEEDIGEGDSDSDLASAQEMSDAWLSDDDLSWSDESQEDDPEAPDLVDKAEPYAVKYWLRHASEATSDIADELSQDQEFWEPGSRIRRRWVIEFARMTDKFVGLDHKSLSALHIAASIGFRQLVTSLICVRPYHKDEINDHDKLSYTPLHLAASFGRLDIVEELLKHGAAINDGADNEFSTPLAMAAASGHVEVMQKLMRRGADPNSIHQYNGPVINFAISSGKQAAVELLVNTGKVALWIDRDDIQSPLQLAASSLSDISMFDYLINKYAEKLPPTEFNKALIAASEAGQIEVFTKLTEYYHSEETLQQAVEAAAEEDNWDIVLALLDKYPGLACDEVLYMASKSFEDRIDVLEAIWTYSNGNMDGRIAASKIDESLYEAADREKATTVEFLLDKFNASPNAAGFEFGNALTAAAYDGNLPILKILLHAGADVNAPEGYAIQTAAEEGHINVVEELIKWNADVNAFAPDETLLCGTALQAACENSKLDIVRLLLRYGANPNLGGGEYSPPIIAASRFGDEKVLEALILAKANLDAIGGEDESSALIYATECHPVSSLKLLVKARANVNLANASGNTALIVACEIGDEETVKLLLDNDADITRSNKKGANALQTAVESVSWGCLELLVDHVSTLLGALETAIESGDTAILRLVQSVARLRGSTRVRDAQGPQLADQSGPTEVETDDNVGDDADTLSNASNSADFRMLHGNVSSGASYSNSVDNTLNQSSWSPQPPVDTSHTSAASSFVPSECHARTYNHALPKVDPTEQTPEIRMVNQIRRKPAPASSGLSPAASSISVAESHTSSSGVRSPMATPPPSGSRPPPQYRNVSGNSYPAGSGHSTPDLGTFGNLFQTPVTSPMPSFPRTDVASVTHREGGASLRNAGLSHPPRYVAQLYEESAAGLGVRGSGWADGEQRPTALGPRNQNYPPSLRPGYGYGPSTSELGHTEYRGVVQAQHQQDWQQRPSNQRLGCAEPSPGPSQSNLGPDQDRQQQFTTTPPRTPFWRRI